jgi:hypothetical protein
MQVKFESNTSEASELRGVSIERLRFVMRRTAWLVSHAKVHLSDINGPHGGVDKRCRIEIKTNAVGTVVITSQSHDWRSALEQALSRASQTLLRVWRRKSGISRDTVRKASNRIQFASLT